MNELLILIPLLLLCGVVAGTLSGLLGVGGGIVIVPMLYHVYTSLGVSIDIAMPLSVGTSLSTIIFTSFVSVRGHQRRGNVDWNLARYWSAFIVFGVLAGILSSNTIPGTLLKTMFGVLLMLVAVHMIATARHAPHVSDRLPARPIQSFLGMLVGGFSSLLGIGGGTLAVPLLNLFSFPMHRAIATATVFGLVISLPATLGYVISGWGRAGLPYASTGFVNWLAFATLVPASMLFAPVGVRLCHQLNVSQLKQVFAVFLLLVGAKMTFF